MRGLLLEQVGRDDDALDLARALVDLGDARVAVVALDVALLACSRSRRGSAAPCCVTRLAISRGVELGHRRSPCEWRTPLSFSSAARQHEQARRVDLGRHVGEHELDRLVLADGLAEGLALPRVGAPPPRSAARAMPSACAAMPMRPPSSVLIATLKPSPSLPSDVLRRHAQSSKNMVHECAALMPSFLSGAARMKPGVSVGTRNAVMPLLPAALSVIAKSDDRVGLRAVGDPVLRAVDDVVVALLHRDGLLRRGVGAALGLGEAEAAELLAAGERARGTPASAPRCRTCSTGSQ